MRVSRPTVDAILTRFEHEHFAGLVDKRRGPKAPRKLWLPVREGFDPPIPRHVLGEAKGRLSSAEDLYRKFVHHLFRRTTNRFGCVALPHDHFHVEEGLPQQPVLVWLSGDRLRVACESVVVAEDCCHDAWRVRKIQDIGRPVFYQTRFVSAQRDLLPWSEQRWLVVYRPRQTRRREPHARLTRQLPLFEEGSAS